MRTFVFLLDAIVSLAERTRVSEGGRRDGGWGGEWPGAAAFPFDPDSRGAIWLVNANLSSLTWLAFQARLGTEGGS